MTKAKFLLETIKQDETVDSDYWFAAGYIGLQSHLANFDKSDWEELKNMLPQWTSHQLNILADALIYPKMLSNEVEEDTNEIYGYIFTLVDLSEADYLIQELKVLDDGREKSTALLHRIKQQISELENYTADSHNVHNYQTYFSLIDNLIEKASR